MREWFTIVNGSKASTSELSGVVEIVCSFFKLLVREERDSIVEPAIFGV